MARELSEAFYAVVELLERRMQNTGEDMRTAAQHIVNYLDGPRDEDLDDPALD